MPRYRDLRLNWVHQSKATANAKQAHAIAKSTMDLSTAICHRSNRLLAHLTNRLLSRFAGWMALNRIGAGSELVAIVEADAVECA